MAPRSRTGCLTCRQRKLKCSEERPVCAQCLKAHRECVPSSGITFRHQQNPSMNGTPANRESLKSFYGYKETFGHGTVWVNVPSQLTFVHTSNPYDDEDGQLDDEAGRISSSSAPGGAYVPAASLGGVIIGSPSAARGQPPPAYGTDAQTSPYRSYSTYATHGLEALSAVASQDQYNYAPPPAPMSQSAEAHASPTQQQPPTTSPVSPNSQSAQASTQGIDFLLNPPSTNMSPPQNSNIDPRLHSPMSGSQPPAPFSTNDTKTSHVSADLSPEPSVPAEQTRSTAPLHVRTLSYTSTPSFGRPSLHSQGLSARHEPAVARNAVIDDPELAFLLRDYSERGGLWMDLFDLDLFFATEVPVLAVNCPLLLYSCAALSAKGLSRVDARKPMMNGQVSPGRRSKLEMWPGPQMSVGSWVRKARECYDAAVSLLRRALSGTSSPPMSSSPEEPATATVQTAQGGRLLSTDSDELIAATAILCVYEFLDASGPEWSRHLDGAKSLFEIANDKMVPLTLPPGPGDIAQQVAHRLSGHPTPSVEHHSTSRGLSKGRRAVFWNFARQDMLSAFINNNATRLDTSDLPMWKSAGLRLTPHGYIYPSNPTHPEFVPENAMGDDIISNALIWILMKLVNYIAAGDEMPHSMSPFGLGVRQNELLEDWESLAEQLQFWHDGLPNSFRATAVRRCDQGDAGIDEKWFPRPMCASTMQSYHFARIQLLHNKPHLSTGDTHRRHHSLPTLQQAPGSSLAARHASYASILHQSRNHAKEIVAIGLGRSDEGTRIHSVQPLWTAGLVLGGDKRAQCARTETETWRRSIVSQLRGIERDMGWASEYRVQNLLDLWGLPEGWGWTE